MTTTTRIQRRYDHRLRDLVQTTGDVDLAVRHGVPRSTARGWRTKSTIEVVSLDVLELDAIRLQLEVIQLRRRVARLGSLLRLVVMVLKVSGVSLARVRLPDGFAKRQLLRAIERSRSHLPLRTVLRVIGVSQGRYHDWIRDDRCALDDRSSRRKTKSPWTSALNGEYIARTDLSPTAAPPRQDYVSLINITQRATTIATVTTGIASAASTNANVAATVMHAAPTITPTITDVINATVPTQIRADRYVEFEYTLSTALFTFE